jgi:hypothetical protein
MIKIIRPIRLPAGNTSEDIASFIIAVANLIARGFSRSIW